MKALFLPSHVGLGHVERDLAIAEVLRELLPGVRVEWCTAEPALTTLIKYGERIRDECLGLRSFSEVVEDLYNGGIAGLGDLADRLRILKDNYAAVSGVLSEGYDLILADEFWEVVYAGDSSVKAGIHFATDLIYMPYSLNFKGFLLSALLNHYFSKALLGFRTLIYLNEASTVDGRRWFPLIGGRVDEWLRQHGVIAGLTTSYVPGRLPSRNDVRKALNVGEDEFLIIVTVGGTSARSKGLLNGIDNSVPAIREILRKHLRKEPRFIAIPGPRTDWGGGINVEVPEDPSPPNLHPYYSAADVFVSRAGRTTTADLICCGKPAVLIPIQGHYEQEGIAKHVMRNYGYPTLRERDCNPSKLAEAIIKAARSKPHPPKELCMGVYNTAKTLAGL